MVILALGLSLAWADLVEPGYVESCTPEVCGSRPSKVCNASWEGREECEAIEKLAGWKQACRTRGASVYSEVFCEGEAPPPAATVPASEPAPADPAPSATPSRCQMAGSTSSGLAWIGLLGLLRRRRS